MEFSCATRIGNLTGQIWGSPEQPVILALHGWMDNSESFRAIAQAMPEYCWVAVDLPGHGHAAWYGDGAEYLIWSYLPILKDLIENLPELEEKAFHVVGHSMGGGVSMLLAAAMPERVRSLVLIDSFGPATTESSAMLQQLKHSLEAKLTPHRVFATPEDSLQARLNVSPSYTKECLEKLVMRNIKTTDKGIERTTDMRLKHPSSVRLTHEQLVSVMEGLTMKVLVVRAENGMLPSKLMEMRAPYVMQLQVVTLAGHHHLHLEPATVSTVAKQLEKFLGEL